MMLRTERVNRASKLPLYHQVYEILRGKILRREWGSGDMLPSEQELCEQYNVSRTTVRQVMGRLDNEGLIERHRGCGTFVARPTVEQNMERIVSFTDDMRERGLRPGTRVLCSELIAAPDDIAESLEVPPGEELARLVRLRLADGEPMAIEESLLVHRYCKGVLAGDYAVEPLREVLDRTYGLSLVRAKQTIRAILADREQRRLLDIDAKAALLFIERVSYSQDDVPVEFLRIYSRGDRYALHNELIG